MKLESSVAGIAIEIAKRWDSKKESVGMCFKSLEGNGGAAWGKRE